MTPVHPITVTPGPPLITETTTLVNYGGLKPPGNTFDVKVSSFWTDSGNDIFSLSSPEFLDSIDFSGGTPPSPLTDNAQTAFTDKILGCTGTVISTLILPKTRDNSCACSLLVSP